MYIKVNENGFILGHDYIQSDEFNISVKGDIFDCSELCYIVKWDGEKLIKLSDEEKQNQPQVISNKMAAIRAKRDMLLKASDFSVLEDAPVDKAAYLLYRQALRDLPNNIVDINNVVFPEEPK